MHLICASPHKTDIRKHYISGKSDLFRHMTDPVIKKEIENVIFNHDFTFITPELTLHHFVNLKPRTCHIHVKKTLHTQFLK